MKKLGFTNPQAILNKDINLWGVMHGPVVGVLKDFHATSFKDGFSPVLISTFKKGYGIANIKLQTTSATTTMAGVEKIWNNAYPDNVFEYEFLDDRIASFYTQENQLSHLYKIFASIAILLSCLGLYGLASFMAVQRIKEVGIRKVLGASAGNIVYLFSKEFMVLITIAFAIASPLAWYYMNQWLQAYTYRINISVWIFLGGGLASVFIAVATVSFQALKAAFMNPVKSLRAE